LLLAQPRRRSNARSIDRDLQQVGYATMHIAALDEAANDADLDADGAAAASAVAARAVKHRQRPS
jgi:hypothetical protein